MGSTEKIGIGYLETFVAQSEVLVPYFKENDRTPTWDGSISLYRNNCTKKNYLATIPVQIKSRVVKRFDKNKTTFNISKTDFDNFYRERGTIFFVVEILNFERKIFVKSLLPSEIKLILFNLSENENSSDSIYLDEIDCKDINHLEYICKHFYFHRSIQYSTIESSLRIEDASELHIPLVNKEELYEQYIFDREYLLYGNTSKEGIIQFIKPLIFSAISIDIKRPVKIGENVYYTEYNRTKEKDDSIFDLGNKIKISINSGKINFELLGNLTQVAKDMKFLLDFFARGEVMFGQDKISLGSIENETELISQVENNSNVLENIKKLLELFNIDSDLLMITDIQKWEFKFIDLLINALVFGKKYNGIPLQFGINAVKVGNLYIGVFAYKFNDEEYFNIIDLFGQSINDLHFFINNDNNNMIKSSPYLAIGYSVLLSISNLNIDAMYKNLISVEYSNIYGGALNSFILELIHCWDKTENPIFLEKSKKLLEWILEQPDTELFDLCKINEMQINKRLRKLSKEEMGYLFSLRSNYKDDNMMLCGINILLDNKSDSEYYFNLLSDSEKDKFLNFPIYTLAINLGMFDSME